MGKFFNGIADIVPLEKIPVTTSNFDDYAIVTTDNLNKLYDLISGKGFLNAISNIFSKTSNAISSIRIYPGVPIFDFGFSEDLKIAGKTREIRGARLSNHELVEISRIFKLPQPESFLDLPPYCNAKLYLPFLGFVDLPLEDIYYCRPNIKNTNFIKADYNRYLHIYYAFDYSTGTATAYVTASYRGEDYAGAKIILTKSGKISEDIPWGSTNNAENLRNTVSSILSTTVGVVASVATKNPTLAKVGVASSISSGATKVINSQQTIFERGGEAGNSTLLFSYREPYVIFTKPLKVDINKEEYAHTYGIPLNEERVLSTVRGFTIIEDIHLTGFNTALDGELDEIEELLKSGVHF